MRIIKLSEEIFADHRAMTHYFEAELFGDFFGKFRFTEGRIEKDSLSVKEEVLFSYNGIINYKALTKTGRTENTDEFKNDYPFYFIVNQGSLRSANISLNLFEKEFQKISGQTKSIVQTRGWPRIEDEKVSNLLWNFVK